LVMLIEKVPCSSISGSLFGGQLHFQPNTRALVWELNVRAVVIG
jgi:hypothetical protein